MGDGAEISATFILNPDREQSFMRQILKFRNCANLVTLLTAAWLLSGCAGFYPHTSWRSDEIRGRVFDAKTHLPIKGAKVQFCNPPHHTIYTDAHGYFRMKATKNSHWFAGADGSGYPNPKDNGLCISHKDYDLGGFSPGYDSDPLNILLKPKQ